MMPDWEKDAAAGKLILERAGLEVFHSPLHLEGGSIHTDGEGCVPFLLGVCLTCPDHECLLNTPVLLPARWRGLRLLSSCCMTRGLTWSAK